MNLRVLWQALSESRDAMRRARMMGVADESKSEPWTERATCMRKYRRTRARRTAMAKASRRRNR